MIDNSPQDTSVAASVLFRFAVVILFFVMAIRLFQLQILQGEEYRAEADINRLRAVEIPAPRGIIYDRNGTVLVRNRPTFQISIVPEDIPFDDLLTPDVDEEAAEIETFLIALGADQDQRQEVAIRIAEIMLRRLGRTDFIEAVEDVGITLNTFPILNPEYQLDQTGFDPLLADRTKDCTSPVDPWCQVPDVSAALPLPVLVSLLQKAVAIGRLGSSAEPIIVMDFVDRIQAFEISEESYRLRGVRVDQVPVREYIYSEQLSHVLGFMGPIPATFVDLYRERGYNNLNERVGLSGLEFAYQDVLRGRPGLQNVVVDILGREQGITGDEEPLEPGQSLILTLDLPLQQRMHELLGAMLEEKDAPWGVTITMNPQTGGILGMVSLPSFDNNIFAESIAEEYLELEQDERKPLINYAIGGLYPPGSVFKIVTASGALQEGIVSSQDVIRDDGPIYLPNRFFPDDPEQAQEFVSWNHKLGINHGPLNIVQALALSNDIYFYLIGGGFPPPNEFEGLGDSRLASWASHFNYGDVTGIDLPGEVAGLVPDDQWKRQTRAESWTTGDSYNVAIGQGDVLVTPLQVLVATAAIANGGTVYRPQLVNQIVDAEGGVVAELEPVVVRELALAPQVVDVVRQGMWSAVNSEFGTSVDGYIDGLQIGAKTGTAEFCEWDPEELDCRYRDEDDNLPTHAWYVAFAPYDNPEIINVTFIYRGGEGSDAALPVTTEILRTYFTEIAPSVSLTPSE